jgi:hypothetical protein
MQYKLRGQIYNNADEMKKDMNLMFQNCLKYNGKSKWLIR